ncbi:site-2 protease family protein [Virgibacillus ainsalahensis]
MDIYLLLYLIFIVAPCSTTIHELGHAFAARSVNADRITLSVGMGKRIWKVFLGRVQIIFHLAFFVGGLAKSERKIPYQSVEIIWFTIWGPITSGIFALLAYILFTMYPNGYLQLLYLFNLWLAVVNIIPFKMKEKQTDGYIILKTILRNNFFFKR